MNVMQQADAYFNAWNAHDTDAVTALFSAQGSYADPNVPDGVAGPHLAGYVNAIFGAFSDLEFEIVEKFETGNGAMVAEWLMKNTHDGEMRGLPPTGRIDSVRGYFSNGTMMEQLDCQVIMQPKRFGPVGFGNSTYTSTGNTAKPGVLGITQIQVTPPALSEEIFAALPDGLAEMHIFKGCGHGVERDDKAAALKSLREFIRA
jgi:steroid delta-isomerase-like uncharacterized protein